MVDISNLTVVGKSGVRLPCKEAIEFCNQFETLEEAWIKCPSFSWMLWYLRAANIDISPLSKILCVDLSGLKWEDFYVKVIHLSYSHTSKYGYKFLVQTIRELWPNLPKGEL